MTDKTWTVSAVGTLNGNAVLWVYGPDMKKYVVPITVGSMAKLAKDGVPIRNVYD